MKSRICNPGAGRTRARRRDGMAVIELLIALAISGMVLVAVAYCVDTAFKAYSINQEQSDLMQRSRLAMHRILTTIRTTSAHQPVDPLATAAFEAGLDVTDTAIRMIDVNEVEIMFRFDPVNGMLMAVDKNGNEYVLVRGVETFEVKFEPMRTEKATRSGGVYDRLMRATVKLTVKTSGNAIDIDETVAAQKVTLSSSAVPRQNVW
jgi:hypothetical protein